MYILTKCRTIFSLLTPKHFSPAKAEILKGGNFPIASILRLVFTVHVLILTSPKYDLVNVGRAIRLLLDVNSEGQHAV